ncbi:hypothetical protein K458DRAFT_444503 [Lentithecium fluviatile CBS 122367]|uniref:Uncharacterized protein n=1 Tax=Lentithecium fluviatile CBS 122367 TaxID=1168545 RepID=A0A6G1ITN7_9PLEO|nr:hypothetical protein K458DRAFT_444503 [Lentithecium fluviatile CBS 122367]
MRTRHTNPPIDLRTALAHALGYPDYPSSLTAEPYLNYIANRHIGRGTLDEYLELFIRVIEHFSRSHAGPDTVRALLDTLVLTVNDDMFADTKAGSTTRSDYVEDTVMYIMGVWSMLLSSFVQLPTGVRKVSSAYRIRAHATGTKIKPFDENIRGLIRGSSTRLNAFTLNVLGAVRIIWTHNISRHMLLSRHGGRHVLELFALPCAFNATTLTSNAVGISPELAQEIQESYCILFNAWPDQSWHIKCGRYIGIRRFCLCWSCSAYRYRGQVVSKYRKLFHTKSRRTKRSRRGVQRSEYDPRLIELMDNESSDWTQDLFPCLWSRITALEEHLQSAKPWSIWILFRDRRDTLQFWTFFFATVVVLLTFLQVALGVAQVIGSFR